MGVFGKKAKAKDQDGPERAEPSLPKASLTFRRKQKNVQPPKFQFDLDSALPNSNEFRTSMLMPKLSARFSMLREQDDADTKVGKANDDSVLFPKRASRMNLFSHNPLAGIAEQPYSKFKPPFAQTGRSFSLSEGCTSDDGGSVMARSHPLESLTPFAGRPKVYKVAEGSDPDPTSTGETERSSHGDDVGQSTLTGSDSQLENDASRVSHEEQHEPARANSRSTAFSNDTGTSSTSGTPHRPTSTAATSVASNSPRLRQSNTSPSSKAGASDSLDAVEEHSVQGEPAVLNSLALSRSVSSSRSALNLHEAYHKQIPDLAIGRSISPTPSASQKLAFFEFALQDQVKHSNSLRGRYQTASPTNDGDGDEGASNVYSNAIEPRDRGKATAMGLFNRPTQKFDEQQFLERQRQMHLGQSPLLPQDSDQEQLPSSTRDVIDGPNASGNTVALSSSQNTNVASAVSASSSLLGQKVQTMNDIVARSESPTPRPRRISDAQPEVQADATSTTSSLPPNMKARVESLIRRKNAELAAIEAERTQHGRMPPSDQLSLSSGNSTPARSRSDANGVDGGVEDRPRPSSNSPLPPTDIHPAFRDSTSDMVAGDPVAGTPCVLLSRQSQSSFASAVTSVTSMHRAGESPTAETGSGLALSGLISKHLRQESGRSSCISSPTAAGFNNTINPSDSVHTDSSELHRVENDGHGEMRGSDSATSQLRHVPSQGALNSTRPDNDGPEEHEVSHKRAESTETQRERREFDDDLAERQRKIQERLRAISDHQPRSKSQIRQALPHAIQGLMPKTSKGGTVTSSDESPPNDKGKILGFGGRASEERESPSSRPQTRGDRQEQGLVEQQPRPGERYGQTNERATRPGDAIYSQSGGRVAPGGRTTPSGNPVQPSFRKMSYEEFDRQRQRSATPNSSRAQSAGRHRAHSNAVPRSRSRQAGGYPDGETFSSQSNSRGPPVHTRNGAFAERMRGPSRTGYREDVRSQSAMANYSGVGIVKHPRPRQGPGYRDWHSYSQAAPPPPPPNYPGRQDSRRAPSPHGDLVNGRKPLSSKGMISVPAFVPPTSPTTMSPGSRSPRDGESPPIPPLNPERRRPHGTAVGSGWRNFSRGAVDNSKPQSRYDDHGAPQARIVYAHAFYGKPQHQQQSMPYRGVKSHEAEGPSSSKHAPHTRNRLRKINSEGGHLSTRARQQAFRDELESQKVRSPVLPAHYAQVDADEPAVLSPPPRLRPQVFPNRSETSLGIRAQQDSPMF